MEDRTLYDQYKGQGCIKPTPFDTPTQTRRWKKLGLIKQHVHGPRRIGLISKTTDQIRREWINMQSVIAKAIAKQPKPKMEGDIVYNHVLEAIERADPRCVVNKKELMEMVELRADTCAVEYGQYLCSEDGRDTQTECLQEVLDLLSYLMKAYIHTKDHRFMIYHNIVLIIASEIMDESMFKEGQNAVSGS